jgi:hypothetical protein
VAGSVATAPDALAQDADPAEAPSKASCAQAYESAQESRAAGQLQETQKRLSVCARPECPSFVQKDCARWLEEVDRELPSVIIRAEGLDAQAAGEVRVTLDGQPVPNAFGGGPITLDPGRHELVAESPGGSRMARTIVAQQGVQNRSVNLDFAPEQAASAEVAVDTGSEGSSLRPYAYVAWGLGAVGLGTFAVLGTLGRADEQALKDDCPAATTVPSLEGPGVCAQSEADERKRIYEREFLLADRRHRPGHGYHGRRCRHRAVHSVGQRRLELQRRRRERRSRSAFRHGSHPRRRLRHGRRGVLRSARKAGGRPTRALRSRGQCPPERR